MHERGIKECVIPGVIVFEVAIGLGRIQVGNFIWRLL